MRQDKGIEVYGQEYFKNKIKYGYVSFQGKFENYQVGHMIKISIDYVK